jgi:hypothetical protein
VRRCSSARPRTRTRLTTLARAADIRLKCAAINDPAVDFVFDRLAPKLAAANVEHRINVLRCSQAARSVGDVVVTNATRIKASMVVMVSAPEMAIAALLRVLTQKRDIHSASSGHEEQERAGGGAHGLLLLARGAPLPGAGGRRA